MSVATRYRTPADWHLHGASATALNIAMAAVYLWLQRGEELAFNDAPLVALITLNSLIIYVFGVYVVRDLADMLQDLPDKAASQNNTIQARMDTLLGHRHARFFGFGYALLAGIGGYIIAPWEATSPLRSVLALFIFSGNLIVGYALFFVMRYWQFILRNLPDIDFRVLNLSRAPLPSIMRFNSRIVMITAVVSSAAILGLGLSKFEANPPIILFSIFAFAMTAATYAVPVVPISNRLRGLKSDALNKVEAKIHAHIASLTDPTVKTDDLPPLSNLKEARDLLNKVQTLPPGGQVSVSAAAFAAVLPFIPSGVEYLSELFK